MPTNKMSRRDLASAAKQAIDDALLYISSDLAKDREIAADYWAGKTRLKAEDGRSKVISTKARDAVRIAMPVLMRSFWSTDRPVEFIPRSPKDVEGAEQATDYVQYVLAQNQGFMKTYEACLDALVRKCGIWKVYYDEQEDAEVDDLSGLTPEQIMFLAGQPDVEVEEVDPEAGTMRIVRRSTRGEIKIDTVAPEDFFVNASATSLEDCLICGHQTEVRVSDIMEMDLPGVTFDKIVSLAGTKEDGIEDLQRRENYTDDEGLTNDPSMRVVVLTEAYMRVDVEGTGIAQWHRLICAGTNHELLHYERADENPFCLFEVDPEPHTVFGRSLIEVLQDDQDASTSLLRALIDNAHAVNFPRTIVVEGDGDVEDAHNTAIGAVLRARTPQGYVPLVTPYTGSQILPALEYYDRSIEAKTGITRAAAGLGPEALSSTSATAANLANQAVTATVELMVRILAEGGFSQAMRKIHKLARQHPDQNGLMMLRGEYVPVDPRSWAADYDTRVNVGLGAADKMEKIAGIQQALTAQQNILQMMGPGNPLVGMAEVRAALEDLLEQMGVYRASKYFRPFTREQEMQMMQAQAQAAQGQQGSDPNAAYMQAEMAKVQQREMESQRKVQLDAMKFQAEEERKRAEAAVKLDLQRDKMEQDRALRAAEIQGRHGLAVNEQAIKAAQAATKPIL